MQEAIEDFLEDVKASKAEATHKGRKRDLKRFNAYLAEYDLTVEDADTRDVHRFLRREGNQYSHETMKSRWDSVKLLYDFLAGVWDVIEESPMADLKRAEYTDGNGNGKHDADAMIYVTPEEVELLAEHVPNPKLRNELLIKLLYQTGIRRGELVSVKLDHITRFSKDDTLDRDGGGAIRVWSPKTESWRTVYYQPSLDILMDQWIDGGYRAAMHPSEYLFPSNQNEQLNDEQVNATIKKAADNAGIQEVIYTDAAGRNRYRITTHALRHGHAVEALKSGIDVRTVAKHMGHEKLETTMRYLQLIDKDVRESYQRFGTHELPQSEPPA